MAEGWAKEVLDFWFSHQWDDWWKPDPGFDDEIRDKFGILWARMARRTVADFVGDAETALAAVILFDQFPRNMFRGHADQFAT
ncbi:MAG TPA: DUF924 family protein, partial [Allosphingosinicella sp.]|nr:DUF924 family protein [Allosphingosinicella sp.]